MVCSVGRGSLRLSRICLCSGARGVTVLHHRAGLMSVNRSAQCQLRACTSSSAQSSSAASGEGDASTGTDDSGSSSTDASMPVACLARAAEQNVESGKKFSKPQRAALGGLGGSLALAGFGGIAWLHWPLMSQSSLCAAASAGGVAMLALAAKGEVPKSKQKASKPKPMLELKLLNDEVRLKAEMDSLKKLQASRKWPADVEAALAAAEKKAKETAKEKETKQKKDLLAEVERAVAAGEDVDAVRRRLRPRLFVFDFKPTGAGLEAARPRSSGAQLELLRNQIGFILSAASDHDEVLLRLSSPGGAVAPYGLAASQLRRLRDAGLQLTVCVDTVAASGGYMMACVADRIVAAPFASLGSIGVLAGIPNFHKLLDRNDVDFVQVTGGKYKRTVNVLTPNTEEGLAKFRQDVDDIHVAFKDHVQSCRPALDVEKVATGEVWLGTAALGQGLIDSLGTSDDEIRRKVAEGFDAVELTQAVKKKEGLAKFLEGVGGGAAVGDLVDSMATRASGAAKAVWRRFSAPETRLEAPGLRGERC
mmetsp:Transcript_133713/g.257308  ORF Transcript_133713/g.257308 Transcript_133713/m.257308 type:complete len:535 (+) Transcript_133713:58-1662(+)